MMSKTADIKAATISTFGVGAAFVAAQVVWAMVEGRVVDGLDWDDVGERAVDAAIIGLVKFSLQIGFQ